MSTKCKNAAVLPNCENLKKQTKYTERKTIFLKYWNTMRSSKIPRKNQLSINFLDQKIPYFLSLKSLKQELSNTQKT